MNNKKRKFTGLLILLLATLILVGCDSQSSGGGSERKDSAQVQNQQGQYRRVQPIPYFEYSQDRAVYIQIYSAKNEAIATHTIVTAFGTGSLIFQCPSIGYAIPADTSLTNPAQPMWQGGNGGRAGVTVGQAEPNGLFSSKNTDGTYILCVMDNGVVTPIYTEMKVTTFPFPITIDANGVVSPVALESPSITVDIRRAEIVLPEETEMP